MKDPKMQKALDSYSSDIVLYTTGMRRMLTSRLYRNADLPERITAIREEALGLINDEKMPLKIRQKLGPRIDALKTLCDEAEREVSIMRVNPDLLEKLK